MKITTLAIDGFGIYRDVLLDRLPSNLVLVLGDNEAGKSTLLGFLRAMLFGFTRKGAGEPVYPPLRGGRHSGRLQLLLDSGETRGLERFVGASGDRVLVTLPGGEVLDHEELDRILEGATRELYKNVFAFSLGELQTFESLRTDQVRGAISGAVSGAALMAIPRSMEVMRSRMAELFDPADGQGAIGMAIKKLEGVRERLRQARAELSAHDSLVEHLRQIDQELGVRIERNARSRAELDRIKAFQRAWPDWIEIQFNENELRDQPTVENFPDNGMQTLETEKAAIASIQQQIALLTEQRGQLEREIEATVIDGRLLELAPAISALYADSGRYGESRRALQELIRERQGVEDGVTRLLDSLGRDWTRERVQSMSRSVFTRETIQQRERLLSEAEVTLEKAADMLVDRQGAADRAAQEERAAAEALAPYADLKNPPDPAIVEELKKRRGQFASAIADLPLAERQQKDVGARLTEILRELNPAWSREDMAQFDTSVSAHQKIENFEARLNNAESAMAEAQSIVQAAGSRYEELQRRVTQAEQRFSATPKPKADSREGILTRQQWARQLRAALAHLETAARDARHGEERLRDKQGDLERLETLYSEPTRPDFPWLPTVLGALALLAGAVLLGLKFIPAAAALLPKLKASLGDDVVTALLSPAIGGGLALFGLVLIIWAAVASSRSRKRFMALGIEAETHRQAIEGVKSAIAALKAEQEKLSGAEAEARGGAEAAAARLGAAGIPSSRDMDLLDERLQAELMTYDDYEAARHELAALKEEFARASEDRNQAAEALVKGTNALAATREQWRRHLASINLSPELTPRMAFQILSRVETARRLAESADDVNHRVTRMRQMLEEFRALAIKLPALSPLMAGDADLLTQADALFERERQAEERRRQRDLAQAALTEKREGARAAQEELAQARAAHAQAQEQWHKAIQAWREWLRGNGLPEELNPQQAQEVYRLIGAATELMNRSAEFAARIQALEGEIKAYEERAAAAFQPLERTAPAPERLIAAVHDLARELKEHQDRRLQRQEKTRQIGDMGRQMDALNQDAEARGRKITWLFNSVSAADESDFRRRHEIAQQRAELARRWHTILKVTGEPDEGALRAAFSATSDEELRQREAVLNQQIGEAEQEMERLRQRRAELAHRIDAMQKSDQITHLRAEEEALLAEIRAYGADWARHAVALAMLTRAREQFEIDQQPGVIRKASGFFAGMTGGQYEKIMAPLGQDAVEAVAVDGARKRPDELSRGAAEQLYLAIRFGYIQHRADEHERMPLIMDEILVNFDAGRATLAAKIILELAESHQIFYFTCHRQTVEMFRSLRPDLAYYELRKGEFTFHEAPALAEALEGGAPDGEAWQSESAGLGESGTPEEHREG